MFHLGAPLGLLALSGLAVPVLIHLVRRPLRVVRVGNLNFLPVDARAVRSLRWHQRTLLLVRCLLVGALALLLARLQWQPASPPVEHWLLRVPGLMLDPTAQREWDTLLASGRTVHQLAADFPRGSPAPAAAPDVWSLLRELDAHVGAGSDAIVFGPATAASFPGPRPALHHLNVRWRVVAAPPPAAITPAPVRVALVAAPDRAEDARYLRAAFGAIDGVTFSDTVPEWIFQLGDVPLPAPWSARIQAGAHWISDAAGPRQTVQRWFDIRGHRLALRERMAPPPGAPLLTDSAGDALLTLERSGHGEHWRFALRFSPNSSDWPLTGLFPAWWSEQFTPLAPAGTLDPLLAAPAFRPSESAPAAIALPHDLRPACWLVALGLFALERWIAARSRFAP